MTADFLVIGGQKCGTTTLYADLRQHSLIHIPDKETSALLDCPGHQSYDHLFRGAAQAQIRGEVTTTYSMLPRYPGVAQCAQRLAPNAKIIYIVRDPIERVLSHHYHDLGLGLVSASIDQAVRGHAPLLDNSRYAKQLRHWLQFYPRNAILVIRFEDYMADRQSGAKLVQDFLGLPHEQLAVEGSHNTSTNKRIPTPLVDRVSASRAYRQLVRPWIGEGFRQRVTRGLSKPQPTRPAPPSRETLHFLVDEFSPEVEDLASLLGNRPWWDLRTHLDDSNLAEG